MFSCIVMNSSKHELSCYHSMFCSSVLSTGCVDGILIFLNRLAAATPMIGYHNDDLDESYLNALLKLCLPLKVILLILGDASQTK